VLLDDPLSAVDAPTARHLLENAILGSFKDRTCILVSHYVNLVLPHSDFCVVFNGGEIVSHGTREEIVSDPKAKELFGVELELNNLQVTSEKELFNPDEVANVIKAEGTTLTTTEEKATGSVSLDVYRTYSIAAGGIGFLLVFCVAFFLTSFTRVCYDVWLKYWTDANS
jgi:ABC-type sulfate/molybdate transport systems ATPase subunit